VPEFLLEVGFEEMPAGWLSNVTEQFRRGFEDAASHEHLQPSGVAGFSTPRRLVLRAEVLGRQPDREEQVWGPPLRIAKDATGQWTKAAVGFARKNETTVESLRVAFRGAGGIPPQQVAWDAQDEYVLFERKVAGRSALEVLPQLIASLLRSLSFPKRMNWDAWIDDGKGAFPFGRPIRWIVALLDRDVVPFAIRGISDGEKGDVVVRSGSSTYGHRFLPRGAGGRRVTVVSFADLQQRLRENYVILDPAERARRIRDGLAAAFGGRTMPDDHGLLAEWQHLVEHPAVVAGRIPAEFQSLPVEVLQTVLVHHQKYLPVVSDGRVSRFAAVTNGDGSNAAEVVRGMERVVIARLRDAAFFFAEDLKRALEDRVADLAGVTFHQGLGSYKDKTDRMLRLVDVMGVEMGVLTRNEYEAARRAASLAKADLTTLMVREFPELQGVMGAIYLRAQSGSRWENVIKAIQWHYHPVSIEEGSPPARAVAGEDATVFGAVSLADKLDTLAGCFALGLAPSGSSDPFGLRRAAHGAVRVLLDFWDADLAERRPSLRRLIAAAAHGCRDAIVTHGAAETTKRGRSAFAESDLVGDLEAFFLDRLRYVLLARSYPADEVEAVLGAQDPDALEDPHECWVRLQALHKVRSEAVEDFEHLAVAFKRAKNILGHAPAAGVDPELFQEPAERELHAAVARLQTRNGGGYEASLRSLAGLRAPVDRFFDDVLVMAEDPKLRSNRLALLAQALSLFYRIADISKLGG
jgi:glycyl-tRNA synthetase beta chain